MSPARHRENHRALQRRKAILYKQTDKEIKVRNQHQTQNRFAAPTAITRSSKAQIVANPKREAHTEQRWKKKRIQIKKPAKAMIKRQEVLPENRNITSLINNDTNLYIVHYPRAFIIIIVVRIVYVGEWLVLCAHLMVRHVCFFSFPQSVRMHVEHTHTMSLAKRKSKQFLMFLRRFSEEEKCSKCQIFCV